MRQPLSTAILTIMLCLSCLLTDIAQAQIADAMVRIRTTFTKPDYFRPWQMQGQALRTGSGCVIEGNRILTNAHIVSDASFIEVRRSGSADRFVAKAKVISHELDLAILEVEDESFFDGAVPLTFGQMPEIGDRVQAYGFPSGGNRLTVTEGIVSRIDRRSYSHSGKSNLVCQFDASINSGSSGGPVINDGKIVGIVFQSGSGENVSFMVPATVIKHFFDDIADGKHDGVPDVGLIYQYLRNEQQRDILGMEETQSGVLILEPQPGFNGEDMLLPGDILLAVDGHEIANDATIAWGDSQRIAYIHVLEQKQIGDQLTLRLLRDGDIIDRAITLSISKSANTNPVPGIAYESRPTYYILGGVVFCPLTYNYLSQWGDWSDVPLKLQYKNSLIRRLENEQLEGAIVIVDVLPDKINQGYTGFEDLVVSTVNGKKIYSMREFVDAIESNTEPFHVIASEPYQSRMVFRREGLEEKSQAILKKYEVPHDRSADLREQPVE